MPTASESSQIILLKVWQASQNQQIIKTGEVKTETIENANAKLSQCHKISNAKR